MNLYQKITSAVIIFGTLTGCQYFSIEQEKKKYFEERIDLYLPIVPCDRQYNEDPFFEDMSCDEEIMPRKRDYWIED